MSSNDYYDDMTERETIFKPYALCSELWDETQASPNAATELAELRKRRSGIKGTAKECED